MSMSPNGIIAFGISYDEEENPFYYGLDESERIEAREADEEERGEPIYDLGDYLQKRAGGEHDYKAASALEKAAPIEILNFGAYDIERYMVILKGTFQSGPEWSAEPIKQDILTKIKRDAELYTATQIAKLFCAEHGLPPFDNPQWLIACTYG